MASVVIGHFEPDGVLACLLADVWADIPLLYLEAMQRLCYYVFGVPGADGVPVMLQ